MSNEIVPASNELIATGDTWIAMKEQAHILVKSRMIPSSINSAEQAIAIMIKGRELGLPPMLAFSHIHIIKGKPTMSAELMLAQIYKNVPGAEINFLVRDEKECRVQARRYKEQPWQEFSFTLANAKNAGVMGNPTWRNYPRQMLHARCISEMARSLFPDAIMGVSYVPEELGAKVDSQGAVVEVQAADAVLVEEATPEENDFLDECRGVGLTKAHIEHYISSKRGEPVALSEITANELTDVRKVISYLIDAGDDGLRAFEEKIGFKTPTKPATEEELNAEFETVSV